MSDIKYKKLASIIKSEINSGALSVGDKLEPEKLLMEKYGYSRQTIRNAIAVLEQDGYVRSIQGSGTFIVPRFAPPIRGGYNIGVIYTHISEYISPSIIRSIESVLTKNSASFILKATNNQIDLERQILQSFIESPPDGIIVEGSKAALPNPNIKYYRQLKELGVPVLFIHAKHPELTDFISVVMDDHQAGFDAASYLAQMGHQKIAGFFKSTDLQSHLRYSGYLDGIIASSLPISDDNIFWFQDKEQLEMMLKSPEMVSFFNNVTAVVSYNEEIASLLSRFFADNGISVPQDISLISFDDSWLGALLQPALTTFAHPKETLGAAAAEKMLRMIEGCKEDTLVMGWELKERKSVARL